MVTLVTFTSADSPSWNPVILRISELQKQIDELKKTNQDLENQMKSNNELMQVFIKIEENTISMIGLKGVPLLSYGSAKSQKPRRTTWP